MNMQSKSKTWTSRMILRALEEHKDELHRLGVRRIGLFGSYRHDTPSAASDIDFLVVLEKPSFDAYMEVKFLLEDLFGSPVDLVMEETIKPRLRSSILEEAIYAQGL